MKLRLLVSGFVLGSATALVATHALSQEDPNYGGADEQARMREMWMKMATPGDPHRKLDRSIGEWNVTTRMWMGGDAMESEGTVKCEWVLGGRFVKSEMKGEMMGQPVEGLGFTGYDNYKKKYVSVWMDSNATAMHHSEGIADRTGDVITYFGTMDEWMTGEHDKPVKYVDRWITDDHAVFEIHDLGIVPGETRVIEMEYTRKGTKAAGGKTPTSRPGR